MLAHRAERAEEAQIVELRRVLDVRLERAERLDEPVRDVTALHVRRLRVISFVSERHRRRIGRVEDLKERLSAKRREHASMVDSRVVGGGRYESLRRGPVAGQYEPAEEREVVAESIRGGTSVPET